METVYIFLGTYSTYSGYAILTSSFTSYCTDMKCVSVQPQWGQTTLSYTWNMHIVKRSNSKYIKLSISKERLSSDPPVSLCSNMMTSSNGNIFRVTVPLCGEFTGHRWIPFTKASDSELWCFLSCALNKRLCKKSSGWWFETPSRSLWRHCNEYGRMQCNIYTEL